MEEEEEEEDRWILGDRQWNENKLQVQEEIREVIIQCDISCIKKTLTTVWGRSTLTLKTNFYLNIKYK